MTFAAQHVNLVRVLALSKNKQNAYGTALADAAFTYAPRFDGASFPEELAEFTGDAMDAGKGQPFPTQRQRVATSVQFALQNLKVTPELAGWLMAFALMNIISEAGAGPYTHNFAPLVASTVAPVTTLYTEDGGARKNKWLDMAINDLTIKGAEKGALIADVAWVGSGKYTAGALAANPAIDNLAVPNLLGSDTTIMIGAQAGAADIKPRGESWQVKIANNLSVRRSPGGGLVGQQTEIDQTEISVDIVFAVPAADDEHANFSADTIREVQINTNSGAAAQLNFKFFGLYWDVAKLGKTKGNMIAYSASASTKQGIIKSGANPVLQATVINNTASGLYLVGA